MTRVLRVLLQLLITVLALWLAYSVVSSADGAVFLGRESAIWFGSAALLHLGILFLISIRLKLLISAQKPSSDVPFRSLVSVNWIGIGGAQVAFGIVGGDAFRVLTLRRLLPEWRQGFGIVLLDRFLGLFGLFILVVLVAMPFAGPVRMVGVLAAATVILGAVSVLGLAWIAPEGRFGRIGRLASLAIITLRGWRGAICMFVTVLAHGLNVLIFLSMAQALQIKMPLAETLVAVPVGILGTVLPISLGGWGVRELSIASTFQLLGSNIDGIVAVSIAFGLTHVAMGVPGLVLYILWVRARSHL